MTAYPDGYAVSGGCKMNGGFAYSEPVMSESGHAIGWTCGSSVEGGVTRASVCCEPCPDGNCAERKFGMSFQASWRHVS
jgi:hypothetical protein